MTARWWRDRTERSVSADDWLSPTVEKRFWSKIDTSAGLDGCWPWLGNTTGAGYGSMATGTLARPQIESAHRIAYVLQVGPIPAGMTVDHLCFVRSCQNAAHMELVSRSENGRRGNERRKPGRYVNGERQGNARLTEAIVRSMRREYWSGQAKLRVLADRYGVSESAAWSAITGETWRHLGETA